MKAFSIIGIVGTIAVVGAIGFVTGAAVTAKAAFSGALALASMDIKVDKKEETGEKKA